MIVKPKWLLTIIWADQKWWRFPECEGCTSLVDLRKTRWQDQKDGGERDTELWLLMTSSDLLIHESHNDIKNKQTADLQSVLHSGTDLRVLATHRPDSGCCTSCRRSRHPLYEQTPPQPCPASLAVLASRPHTHRTVPERWSHKHSLSEH